MHRIGRPHLGTISVVPLAEWLFVDHRVDTERRSAQERGRPAEHLDIEDPA